MNKEFEITIGPNGDDVKIDKLGFNGQSCSGQADDIIAALGQEVSTVKKNDYYRSDDVHVQGLG